MPDSKMATNRRITADEALKLMTFEAEEIVKLRGWFADDLTSGTHDEVRTHLKKINEYANMILPEGKSDVS